MVNQDNPGSKLHDPPFIHRSNYYEDGSDRGIMNEEDIQPRDLILPVGTFTITGY